MRAMKLSRLGAGAFLSIAVLTILGACSSGNDENIPCGIHGVQNGTCQQGATCPSGSTLLMISDPSDECPQGNVPADDYVCCVPAATGAAATTGAAAAPTDGGIKG
jgi:hypothetical protein